MKNDFERFHKIIADSKMEIAEKYGRMVAHLEKIEKELREIKNAPEDYCDLFDELDDAESLIQELIRQILGEST